MSNEEFEKALSSYAADEHIFGSLNLIRRIGKHFYDVRQSEIDGLRKAAEELLDALPVEYNKIEEVINLHKALEGE